MTTEDIKKKKRVNRNKKKAWRKHADVADVEEHLDEVRLQERTGGLVAEKSDDQLFFVDTTQVKDEPEDADGSKKGKGIGSLRCHALLEPNQSIAAITKKRQQPTTKVTFKQVRDAKGLESDALKKVRAQSKKAAEKVRQSARLANRLKVTYDVWGAKGVEGDEEVKALDEHFVKTTKLYRPKTPQGYLRKPSGVKAVEAPHPGASYNPTADDHQDLLKQAHETELKKVKAEEKIERALTMKFPDKRDYVQEDVWLKEMSQGLDGKDEDDDEEEEVVVKKKRGEGDEEEETDEDEPECVSYNPPVRRDKKKTEAQRRRELEHKQKDQKRVNAKLLKTKQTEIFRLKSIKKEIVRSERSFAARAQRKLLREEATKDLPKRLGPHKFQDPELEVKLSDEIEGSLRKLKPEGSLLEDRLKSLQKRNIIEPRKKAKSKRRYALKKQVKRRFKAPVE